MEAKNTSLESFHSVNAMSPILAKTIWLLFRSPLLLTSSLFSRSQAFASAAPRRLDRRVPTAKIPQAARHKKRIGEVKKLSHASMMPESFKWQPNAWQASNKTKRTRQHVRPRGFLANGLSRGSPAKPPSVYPTKQYPVQQQAAHILIPVWTRKNI